MSMTIPSAARSKPASLHFFNTFTNQEKFLPACVMLIREVSGIGCPFQWLTGISCAGCGMTRAVLCAVRFQFGEAFYYHPLFWVIPFGAVLFCFREKIPARYRKGLAWITVVCFGAVYLVRLFFSDHQVVVADMETGLIVRLWKYFFT